MSDQSPEPNYVSLGGEELDELVTNAEAAEQVGVSPSTISNWVARGHLKPSGIDTRDGRDVYVYKLIDVLRAARDTRRRGIGQNRLM